MQINSDQYNITISSDCDVLLKNSIRRSLITLSKLTPTSIECFELPYYINGEFLARRIGQIPLYEKDKYLQMNDFDGCDCTKKLQPRCEKCTMFLVIHEQCDGAPLRINDKIQVINNKTIFTSTVIFFDVNFFEYYRLQSDDFFTITNIEEKEDRYSKRPSGKGFEANKSTSDTFPSCPLCEINE